MPTINLPKKVKYKKAKETNKKDNENNKFVYNTPTWRTLRLNYLMENPLCVRCEKNGLIVSAVEVHHITPISSGKDILNKKTLGFNWNNLKSLCKECHKIEHREMRYQNYIDNNKL